MLFILFDCNVGHPFGKGYVVNNFLRGCHPNPYLMVVNKQECVKCGAMWCIVDASLSSCESGGIYTKNLFFKRINVKKLKNKYKEGKRIKVNMKE